MKEWGYTMIEYSTIHLWFIYCSTAIDIARRHNSLLIDPSSPMKSIRLTECTDQIRVGELITPFYSTSQKMVVRMYPYKIHALIASTNTMYGSLRDNGNTHGFGLSDNYLVRYTDGFNYHWILYLFLNRPCNNVDPTFFPSITLFKNSRGTW